MWLKTCTNPLLCAEYKTLRLWTIEVGEPVAVHFQKKAELRFVHHRKNGGRPDLRGFSLLST
jgi:hypothetical protein